MRYFVVTWRKCAQRPPPAGESPWRTLVVLVVIAFVVTGMAVAAKLLRG